MKMSAIILAAGLLVTGLPAAAQSPALSAQQARYDPYYGNHYDRGRGWDRRDRQWDRQERRWDRQHRRWSRQRGYGYGYGYGRGPRCWTDWQYGRRVRVCR